MLQAVEGAADALVELLAVQKAELGFGIVQVEDVDGVDAQIGAAAIDLVGQKIGIHGMHPAGYLFGFQETRDGAGREESGLGADHDLVALQLPQRCADRTFRPLVAVVDGGVEEVDAAFAGRDQCGGIAAVGRVVVDAQIGADAEAGNLQSADRAIESGVAVLGKRSM